MKNTLILILGLLSTLLLSIGLSEAAAKFDPVSHDKDLESFF
jgi:hypothetical protein